MTGIAEDAALKLLGNSIYAEDHVADYWQEVIKIVAPAFRETGPGEHGRWQNGCTSPHGHRFQGGSGRCIHCGDRIGMSDARSGMA